METGTGFDLAGSSITAASDRGAVLKPIYLLADSQLLFWKDNGTWFLESLLPLLPQPESVTAAYVGASNGDDPQFFEIFESAMENIGVMNCRMIRTAFDSSQRAFLERADVILLAGGDIERGWEFFRSAGIVEILKQKYQTGAVLMGVSAGAVQLGECGWKTGELTSQSLFDTLRLVPFTIGAHEEKTDWEILNKIVSLKGMFARGIGIPSGAGLIYHPDRTVEAIRHPSHEFFRTSTQTTHSLLFPKKDQNLSQPAG